MDVQGLEAQLLREVVAEERGELEEAKERLLLSLAADTRQLQDLQDRILKLLKVTTLLPVPRYLCHHSSVTTPDPELLLGSEAPDIMPDGIHFSLHFSLSPYPYL